MSHSLEAHPETLRPGQPAFLIGYCETKLAETPHPDIEHYRPKLRVTDENDKVAYVDYGRGMEAHRGYWWLPSDLGVLVDRYHNGASGVRAQCLANIDLGNRALDVARDALRSRALDLVSTRGWPKPSITMVEASLGAESSKVWIYQGLWVRRARADARDLLVSTWHEHASNKVRKVRDLVRYGSKAPTDEHRIEVIGAWLDETGHPQPGKEPGLRATQIHQYGFT